jgi:hypothetical protein
MCRADRYIAGAVLAAVLVLAGCSDIYFDRRETVSFHAGDASASNASAQSIDPWPAEAGNRRITYNGERMQKAAERYRTNKTTPLNTSSTSSVQYQPVPAAAAPAAAPGTP